MAGGVSDSVRTGNVVRIVVAGDAKTGKSSLIVTATAKSLPRNVRPVLPPTYFPQKLYSDLAPVIIIDTSSSPENRGRLVEELTKADAVVLTYACDRLETIDRLSTFWLPELRRLEVRLPVIVVGCMLDRKGDQPSMMQVISPIIQQFLEIETWMECSAANNIEIPTVFKYAQKSVLYPVPPLFDQEQRVLKSRCVRALKRIFILCDRDRDRDAALSDSELNDFQDRCFGSPFKPSLLACLKREVQKKLQGGVNERGLTLSGLLFLHEFYSKTGSFHKTWTVLRKFGYNNELRLREDQLPAPIKKYPDQSVELSSEGLKFLKNIFTTYDVDDDGALRSAELEDLFSTAPENPWNKAPYVDAAAKTALGGLSIDGFLSLWALMTLRDPIRTVETLICIGYSGDPSSAISVTRRRHMDRKKHQTERTVHQCFVFGPKGAGKSAILNSFIGRPFPEEYVPTTDERYAVNVIDQATELKKILVLREIPGGGVKELLSKRDALAACDVAIFVHDRS